MSGVRLPPIQAYMDDLTVTTSSVLGSRWILQGLERLIKWARMSFKTTKSRSRVLKKSRVFDMFHLALDETIIQLINEKPVKSLGKPFDQSLRDSAAIQTSIKELESRLSREDSQDCQGSSSPEPTSTAFCLAISALCWFTMFPLHQWNQWSGRSAHSLEGGLAYNKA